MRMKREKGITFEGACQVDRLGGDIAVMPWVAMVVSLMSYQV
jgi:hypothetical protein